MDQQGELSTKQRFIIETYRLLQDGGIENLRVRDVAGRVGYTAAALYKHFDNLDYLIMLASIRFLDSYAEELIPITKYSKDPLSMDLQAWKCFINHAFRNVPIYLHLFWENGSGSSFGDAMSEYMSIFPPDYDSHRDPDDFYGYFYSAMFTGSLQERDYIWLRKAAGEGLISLGDALYVSKVNEHTVHGMLMNHINDYKDPTIRGKAIEECNRLVEKTINDHAIR